MLKIDPAAQFVNASVANHPTPLELLRSLVASHSKTTIEMLEQLASDKSAEVRSAVANNPKTPLEVKAMMALLKD